MVLTSDAFMWESAAKQICTYEHSWEQNMEDKQPATTSNRHNVNLGASYVLKVTVRQPTLTSQVFPRRTFRTSQDYTGDTVSLWKEIKLIKCSLRFFLLRKFQISIQLSCCTNMDRHQWLPLRLQKHINHCAKVQLWQRKLTPICVIWSWCNKTAQEAKTAYFRDW